MDVFVKFRLPLLLLSLQLALPAFAGDLPRPVELEDEIGFWKRIFSEVQNHQALVHDNRHLGVVYEVVTMPKNASYPRQRKISENVRRKYRNILVAIADGDRSNLTAEQQQVLSLWPADISNDELRQASRRVRFQGGMSDRFADGLVRSGRWREFIQDQLISQDVPMHLVALPHVESSYNPRAGSSVGATGLWQFTRSTGRRFMQIDHVVDERRDPFVSSAAAAQLLSYNHSVLDSWPLAITAYNHGVSGMRRAVKQLGTDEIHSVVHNYSGKRFGFASRNFYVAFLAASELDTNYESYFGELNFDPPEDDLMVQLPAYVEFDTLKDVFGVSTKTLRSHNPALMPAVVEGNKYVPKGYRLRVPYAAGVEPQALLASLPSDSLYSSQTPDLYHKVQRGDSLSVLAVRYKTSVRELRALNNLKSSDFIRIGQTLRLPYTDERGTITKDVYVVQSGDTLSEIALRAGTTRSHIVRLNKLSGDTIYVGQKLVIQKTKASEPAAVAVAPVVEPEPEKEALAMPDMAASETDESGVSMSTVDPSDYDVASDGTIEVQASETMGHYADWLGVSTQSLRDLNGYTFGQPVVIGKRVRLRFSNVSVDQFTDRRVQYHKQLQEAFFVQYRIVDTQSHRLKRGESVWLLNRNNYQVPEWLLRQYNPDVDFNRVRPGATIVFPRIERIDIDA